MRVLLTGSQGFISSYLCENLLSRGYKVVGIDDYSKYGRVTRPHDTHPNFTLIERDLVKEIPDLGYFDFIIAAGAKIGGISYFNKYPYDLLAINERIIANTYDYAIKTKPQKVVVISSSMVFESAETFPTKESDLANCKIPLSSYGFQKLATEYFAKAAWDQYGIAYDIVRPFNCVGIGEHESIKDDKMSIGTHTMLMSHVIPDICDRALKSKADDPCFILGNGNQVRHYTNGKDVAEGIRLVMESFRTNNSYNISSDIAVSVEELANFIWQEIHGCLPVIERLPALNYDVQFRSPDVNKAKEQLGFEAKIHWHDSVREVIDWMKK